MVFERMGSIFLPMNMLEINLTPEEIATRIIACREELAALKRLLRAVQAAQKADIARRRRTIATKEAKS